MVDKIEEEITAIRTVLTTLQSLDADVRKNVIEYVLKRLNFDIYQPVQASRHQKVGEDLSAANQPSDVDHITIVHIKQFKETKQPKTAIEMVAIVAYYLQYLAEEGKRKNTIGTSDLSTWFRIADFPLPSGELRYTLANARNSGYLDSAGHGEYKLNAIGYNLVKHNMPRSESKTTTRKPKRIVVKKTGKSNKKSTKK